MNYETGVWVIRIIAVALFVVGMFFLFKEKK